MSGLAIFFSVAITVCSLGMAFCVYMLWRNQRVYEFRMRLIDEDMDRYNQLPGYDEMVNRWWVWPLERFE